MFQNYREEAKSAEHAKEQGVLQRYRRGAESAESAEEQGVLQRIYRQGRQGFAAGPRTRLGRPAKRRPTSATGLEEAEYGSNGLGPERSRGNWLRVLEPSGRGAVAKQARRGAVWGGRLVLLASCR